MIIEMMKRTGLVKMFRNTLTFNDTRKFSRIDNVGLFLFMLVKLIAGYPTDSAANQLRRDPALREYLGADALGSQASISRLVKNMNVEFQYQLQELLLRTSELVLAKSSQSTFILDIDSTHSDTFGHQEHANYNAHYGTNGYPPTARI